MRRIIILEGISGAGKSTLVHPISALSNFADPIMHRWTPSCWVYNLLYNRPRVDYEPMNRKLQLIADVWVIWLRCAPELAYERQRAKGDPLTEDLEAASEFFDWYFHTETSFGQVYTLDTGVKAPEECVTELRERLYP